MNYESEIIKLLGQNMWYWVVGFLVILFRESIQNILSSAFIFYGNDINDDDVLLIDNRPARVVRVGIFKTSFYLYVIDSEGKFVNGTRMQVQNSKLKDLNIEKPLPLFDDTLIQMHKNLRLKTHDDQKTI